MIIFLNLKQKKGNRQRGMCYITINQMIMKTFVFILFFLSLASLSPAFGIPSQFRHYTVENGLSSNAVQCLLQDRTGYIWCGTSDGLNRFDSRHFKTFRHIPGDTASLGNNVIHSLFEDSKGNLWIGTENGVFRYRVSEDADIRRKIFDLSSTGYPGPAFSKNHLLDQGRPIGKNLDIGLWKRCFPLQSFGRQDQTLQSRHQR